MGDPTVVFLVVDGIGLITNLFSCFKAIRCIFMVKIYKREEKNKINENQSRPNLPVLFFSSGYQKHIFVRLFKILK